MNLAAPVLRISFLSCLLAVSLEGQAQIWLDQTTTAIPSGLQNLTNGSLDWGDFDKDGDLDLLVTGESGVGTYATVVYRYNNATGTFADFSGANIIPDVRNSDAQWCDHNADGFLDILISGEQAGGAAVTRLYQYNSGTSQFALTFTFPSFKDSRAAWGDLDNDGDQDLIMTGIVGSQPSLNVYANSGGGSFQDITATIFQGSVASNVSRADIALGDYNADGFLDLLYCGQDNSGNPVTRLFKNNAGVLVFQSNLTNVSDGSVNWGDYDNDGDLDILLAGSTGPGSRISEIYQNDGGTFTILPAGLTAITRGRAVWADINSDGWADILLTGQDGGSAVTSRTTQVYLNNQTGGFILDITGSLLLTNLNNGARLAVGDYNNDKKPDLAVSGTSSGTSTYTLKLYRNQYLGSNTTPAAPGGLTATQNGLSVDLSWTPPAGSLAPGLSYNLYIGTAPGTENIRPAQSNLLTGFRRVAQIGDIKGTDFRINNLPSGTYYWSVQAVEPDFEPSPFATEGSFTFTVPSPVVTAFADQTLTAFGAAPAGLDDAVVAWADTDNDGDLDLFHVGVDNSGTNQFYTYRNNGTGGLATFPGTTNLPKLRRPDIAIGDLNGDNFVDFVICGRDATNARFTKIYRNQGNGQFVEQSLPSAFVVRDGAVALSDYDADGDLDLFVSGNSAGGTEARWYKNETPATTSTVSPVIVLVQDNGTGFIGSDAISNGDATFADYDRDGFPDLALSGATATSRITTLYRNNQDGTFSKQFNVFLPNLSQSSLAWGDANNDGYPELAIMGTDGTTPYASVGQYLAGFFIPLFTDSITDLYNGAVAWADYNADGFLDLVMSGTNLAGIARTRLYQNVGDTLTLGLVPDGLSSAALLQAGEFSQSSSVWGDVDGDKKPDLAIAGNNSGGKFLKIFRNIETSVNTTPGLPYKLTATLSGYNVHLAWEAPPAPQDQLKGLTYNIWVDSIGGGQPLDIKSPNASLTTGYRRVAAFGNVGQPTSWTLTGLKPGIYRWSVQAVDQDLEGSGFAVADTFTYEDPTFLVNTPTVFSPTPRGLRSASIAPGDYNQDGLMDFAMTGITRANNDTILLYNLNAIGGGQYAFAAASSSILQQLQPVREGHLAWADYNLDGYIDLLITGKNGTTEYAKIYRNLSGSFNNTPATTVTLPVGISKGKGIWTDYDIDGYYDVFLTGESNGVPVSKLYRNTGSGTFTEVALTGVLQVRKSDAVWSDFNQDGYPDLLIAGEDASGQPQSRLYLNNQNGGFITQSVPDLPNLEEVALDAGDCNADGFPDIAITGLNSSNSLVGRVLKNNGNGTFSLLYTFVGVRSGSLVWGDYDNDGYKDLLITGQYGPLSSDRGAYLYRYNGVTQQFEDESLAASPVPAVGEGDAVWMDLDANGKLDILATGRLTDAPVVQPFVSLRNIEATPNITPLKPTGLQAQVVGYEVWLTWTPPANITSAIQPGLSYNVALSTTPGGFNRRSPMASLATGRRHIVASGAVTDTFKVKNLPGGTYYWRVQAIDAGLEGSPFSDTASFAFELPTFTNVTTAALGSVPEGVSDGDLAWVDLNQDGHLDLMTTGSTTLGDQTRLYLSNGNGTFTSQIPALPAWRSADMAWADIDHDNDLDLAVCGDSAGTFLTRIYRNNGAVFTPAANITGVSGSVDWGDYNYDGRPDLLVTGVSAGGLFADVFVNQGNNTFTPLGAGLTPVSQGDAAWADYNRDGYPDVVITGLDENGQALTVLYRNTGFGTFQPLAPTFTNLPYVANGKVAWADYNRDGYTDLLLSGQDLNTNLVSRLYRNNAGVGTFSLDTVLLTGVMLGDAAFGDYNNDGWTDLVITGATNASGTARTVRVYRNNTFGGFSERTIAGIPLRGVDQASLAWGDFNGDKKLDLALMGRTSTAPLGRILHLYQNLDTALNETPVPPAVITTLVSNDTVIMSWSAPANTVGYSWNLYVGTALNQTDKTSPDANLGTGLRYIPADGNTGNQTRFKLAGLPAGNYFWKVQTIDPDFEGSAFSAQQSFTYAPPAFVHVNVLNLAATPAAGFEKGVVLWGDYNGDQTQDLLVAGSIGTSSAVTALLKNTGGVLATDPLASADLADLMYAAAAWGDTDQDGDLDLILTGETATAGSPGTGTPLSLLYHNLGNGRFALDPRSEDLTDVTAGAVAWADYDNDGDLDLALAGLSATGRITRLYRNDNQAFVVDTLGQFEPVQGASLAWYDMDRDGDQDLALSGMSASGPVSCVYRNLGIRQGFVRLTATEAPLTQVAQGSLAWADMNKDGYGDLLLTGDSLVSGGGFTATVYRYDAGTGRLVRAVLLPGVSNGQGVIGDYNEDGFPDVILSGSSGTSARSTRVFRNTGTGSFTEDVFSSAALADAEYSSLAWGDIDGNGKPDLALTGRTNIAPLERSLILYQNYDPAVNTTPQTPSGLTHSFSADSVVLSWTPAALSSNYTYNISLGTTANSGDILPAMAAGLTGTRQVAATGNTAARARIRVQDLAAGTYYWRVQAIDAGFEGSAFSMVDSFTWIPPYMVDVTGWFTDTTRYGGLADPVLAWGDYDADHDLDLIVMGQQASAQPAVYLFDNQGGYGFILNTGAAAGITPVSQGDMAWADIDRDGDLDLAVWGQSTSGASARIYTWNQSQGTFDGVNVTTPLTEAAIAWGDYQYDGAPDLVIQGKNSSGQPVTQLLLNNGAGQFTNSGITLAPRYRGDIVWQDLNRDGWSDLVISGQDASGALPAVTYWGAATGLAGAVSAFDPPITLSRSRLDAADYNNDGLMDLLVSGTGSLGEAITRVYTQEGDSTFTGESLPVEVHQGNARWADYNEDGFADIVISGLTNSGLRLTQVLANDQQEGFVADTQASLALAQIARADIAWGDFTLDGKPDLILAGVASESPLRQVLRWYRNIEPTPSTPPATPEDLTWEVIGSQLQLAWNPPAGTDPDRVEGLSYNVYIGTSPQRSDVFSPHAAVGGARDGYRRLPATGNTAHNTTWSISGLVEGKTYYLAVQAIDQGYEGSPFGELYQVDFTPPAFEDVTDLVFGQGLPVNLDAGDIELSDYDHDGDLDLAVIGSVDTNSLAGLLYRNTGGVFTLDQEATATLPDVKDGTILWVDYTQDNRADLLVTGLGADGQPITQLFRNTDGVLVADGAASAALVPVSHSTAAWHDDDHDGDLDLLLAGRTAEGTPLTQRYENQGSTFLPTTPVGLPHLMRGSLAWADYNRDGIWDVLLSGETPSGVRTQVYAGLAGGAYSLVQEIVPSLYNGTVAWGDIQNDGYQDFIITGEVPGTVFTPISELYRYDTLQRRFVNTNLTQLPDVTLGDVRFMDFDNNGWLDFVISGRDGIDEEDRLTKLFRNKGDGTFEEDLLTSRDLVSADYSDLAWGDYNQDGKVDLFLAGRTRTQPVERVFRAYRNIDTLANVTSPAPAGLRTQIYGATITLSWDPPAGTAADLLNGLTYNLYLGRDGNEAAQRSPMAVTTGADNGYRRIVAEGEAGHRRTWHFVAIPDGTYTWSVQAIEPDHEGSPFAAAQTFTYQNPVPYIADSVFADTLHDSATRAESYIVLREDTMVQAVIVHYKGIAAATWQQEVITGVDKRYTFLHATNKADEIGVAYYIEVKGLFGFDARTDTHYTYRYYNNGLQVSNLPFGRQVRDYSIVTVPLTLDNSQIEQVIEDDFGPYSIFRWRMWHYEPDKSVEYQKGLTQLTPGEGYWLITRTERSFNSGPGQAVEAHDGAPFILTLRQGWNQIGNPWPFNLSWQDVLDANPASVSTQLDPPLIFSNGFLENGVINRYRGAFVYADEATTLRIPVRKNPNVQRVSDPGSVFLPIGSVADDTWQLPLRITAAGWHYDLGGIGMNPGASRSRDPLDRITPPRLEEFAELIFEHPEHTYGQFSRDIVPPEAGHTWEFTVRAHTTDPEARLSWDPAGLAATSKRLFLMDLQTYQLVDMSLADGYTFVLGQDGARFRVYLGDDQWLATHLQPEGVAAGWPFPNPTAGPVTIPLALPPADEPWQVQTSVLSLSGQEQVSLPAVTRKPGLGEIIWDGQLADGLRLPAGVYIVRIQVTGQGQTYLITRKLVMTY